MHRGLCAVQHTRTEILRLSCQDLEDVVDSVAPLSVSNIGSELAPGGCTTALVVGREPQKSI